MGWLPTLIVIVRGGNSLLLKHQVPRDTLGISPVILNGDIYFNEFNKMVHSLWYCEINGLGLLSTFCLLMHPMAALGAHSDDKD